jgi:hypothetical protein
MQDPSAQPATEKELTELYDNPLERLQLLGSDEAAISAFLDELDVRGPREREMLRELARTTPLERPDRFEADHRRVVAALESLRRHGYRGAGAAASLPLLRVPIRFLVELVARYVVVSHVKNVVVQMRNLYWLREMEAAEDSRDLALLRSARTDAQALVEITKSREIGVPTFVIGGLLIPAGISLWRLASGTIHEWWIALLVGAIGIAIGLAISWFVLRGPAHPPLRDAAARRALAHDRELRRAAEGPVRSLRGRRHLAHRRRLDRPPAPRHARARAIDLRPTETPR